MAWQLSVKMAASILKRTQVVISPSAMDLLCTDFADFLPSTLTYLMKALFLNYKSHRLTKTHKFCILYGEPTLKFLLVYKWDPRWRSWSRHFAISHKVAGSIPDGVIRKLIQRMFPGDKGDRCVVLTSFPFSFADFLEILVASSPGDLGIWIDLLIYK